MQKRSSLLITALWLCLSIFTGVLKAQTVSVTIGAGASSTYLNGPIYRSSSASSFRFSKHAYLYTAADMSGAGIAAGTTINTLSWYKAISNDFTVGKYGVFKIYVLDTAASYTSMWSSSSATTPWNSLISNATLVYADTVGSTLLTGTGFINFNLTTPFTYTGGALRIMVSWNYMSTTPAGGGAINWAVDAASTGTVMGVASNAALINDTTLLYAGAAPGNGGTFSANRPEIEFTFNATGCAGMPSGYTVQGPTYSLCNGDAAFLGLGGIQSTTGISYLWQSSTNVNGPYTNAGSTATTFSTPALTATTYYRVLVACANSGLTDTVTPLPIVVNTSPGVTGTTPGTRCGTGSVTLSAAGSAPHFVWYDDPQGGNIVGTSSSISPTVSTTTTYYVANSSGDTTAYRQASPNVGATVVNGGIDSLYLKFNVYHAVRLQSVVIYAGYAQTYNIRITDNNGVSLGTGSVVVSPSQVSTSSLIPITVPLNVYLPTGNGYHIFLYNGGASAALYWNYTGLGDPVSYPYALSGLLSITNAGFVVNGAGYFDTNDLFGDGNSSYTGFYHFTVIPDCESSRTPVVATVNTPPTINVGIINNGYCSSSGGSATIHVSSADNNYAYTWAGGAYASVSGNVIISVNPTVSTTYTVTGSDISTGCAATNTAAINVLPSPLVFNTLVTPSTTCPGVPLKLTTNIYSSVSYCSPSYITGTANGAFLDSVVLGSLVYSSSSSAAADLVVPASTTTTSMTAGGTYTIRLASGAGNAVYNVWIDLNGDGNYDNTISSQEILVNNVSGGTATSVVTFTLPSYIVSGVKRMRVRLDRGFIFQGPCSVAGSNSSYNGEGQTIDFYVTVSGNSLSYAWTPSATLSPAVGDSVTSSGVNSNTTFTVTVHDLTSGCSSVQTSAVTITPAAVNISADPSAICGSGSTNLYTLSLTSGATVNWQSSTAAAGPFTNVGSTANPYTTATNTSAVYYRGKATCGTSTATSNVVLVNVSAQPGAPAAYNTNTCGAASVTLKASGAGTGVNYNWFDSATTANPIFTGANFATPTLSATRMYYVSAYKDLGTNNTHTGKAAISNGSGGPNYFYNAEMFQTYVPITLNGVYVYPSYNLGGLTGTDGVTWFNIQLWDSNGNVLDTMHVNVTAQMVANTTNGIATYVALGFRINSPAVYYLERGGPLSNSTYGQSYIGLWRDNVGSVVHYPYTLSGVMSIENSLVLSATSASYNPNGYYYFYNWSVGYDLRCGGARVADTVTVNPVTVAGSVTPTVAQVCNNSSQLFNVSGNAGSTLQWQYTTSGSTASNSAWSNFGTLNASSATLSNITGTTYVRAVSASPACATASSNSAKVNVDSAEIGITISSITASSATVSWNSILGAAYTLTVNGNTYNPTGNSYALTSLSSCTSYSVTVTATGGTCGGIPTGTTGFKTKPAVLTLSLSAGTGTAIVATWSAGVGPYKLYYAQQQGPQSYTVVNVTGTTYTIPAKSATAGTSYIAYVVDAGSTCTPGAQSTYAYYKTPGGSCTATAPVITSATATASTFTISWAGSASAYQVYYKTTAGSWVSYNTGSSSYTINGATPGACYPFFVVNRCGTAYGYASPVDTICTSSECAAPLNLQLSQATCKGFTATWNAVSGASSYQVFGSVASGSGAPWVVAYPKPTNYAVFSIYAHNTTVSVYVKSNCAVGGTSASSSVETITTLSTGCKDELAPASSTATNTMAVGSMNVYPNPNGGQFIVDALCTNTTTDATLQVINLLGQVMSESVVSNNNGLVHTAVNSSNLAAGIYLVRVQTGPEIHTARVVIQR